MMLSQRLCTKEWKYATQVEFASASLFYWTLCCRLDLKDPRTAVAGYFRDVGNSVKLLEESAQEGWT
jgi:hypothetical protein